MKRTNLSAQRRDARPALAAVLAALLAPMTALGCGLDWSLPQAHFEGVEEHGYVAYWETLGEIDLGNKVVIPVHAGFNSHRETSSPVLGKGWIVALLESHVEPIDENAMNVIMPDGWTFLFLRNGNSETWRGNAGWAGETDDAVFTIAAPCGWKIRYDRGKIQEIDGSKAGALTWRYDGGAATEIDQDGRAVVQVERDPVGGAASALVIDGRRVEVAQAQRPRVINLAGRNLVNGFDSSLASLQWPDGTRQTFAFGTDDALNPTLSISGLSDLPRTFVWDAATRRIKTDGGWSYALEDKGGHLRFTRVSVDHEIESYEADAGTGMTAVKTAGGAEVATYRFVSGPLAGSIRRMEELGAGSARKVLYSASYYPTGELLREAFYPDMMKIYSPDQRLLKETIGGHVIYQRDVDSQGRVVRIVDATRDLEVRKTYDTAGGQTTQVFQRGALYYTEQVDRNNRLVSLNEGGS